ncbi:MAG TPA: AAA family ATPase, partial [Geobacteraceae bacterium]|nr:AAA family ATPase [Geobacteraceae bacterium]
MENLNVQGLLKTISSGVNLIYVITDNERRTEGIAAQAAARLKGADLPYVWNCTEGMSRGGVSVPETVDPLRALDFAIAQPGPLVLVFKDLAWFWKDGPFIVRKLKEFAVRSKSKALIVLGQAEEVPEGLREDIVILNQGLPTIEEIRTYLGQLVEREPLMKKADGENPGLIGDLVLAAQGLDLVDIERGVRALRATPEARGDEIVRSLFETKRLMIRKSGIMEFVVNEITSDKIGGVENLKFWLERREKAFGIENISAGINMPKGVLIMGIAGCGKSLFVKAIASQWRMPLIRLDMATVYAGTYGSPESSLRKAFKTAEAVAPCVLWIDEIEAGISSQGFKSEGGAASRILGSFLTWMQEKRAPVFVAATANAIEMLPAEVLRKGRFDEIFYIALPDVKAREEIFRIHLSRQKIDLRSFDVPLLAGSTKGFSGAEIEQAVLSAAFEALTEQRPMIQQDLMAAISRTVPLSVTMAEQIKKIEAWAFKRAVPASGK